MIRSFKNKGLAELFQIGRTAKINKNLHARIIERLDALDAAVAATDMNMPGYDFHGLSGFIPARYTVHVNGPWCVTFEFELNDAFRVDFEQYH